MQPVNLSVQFRGEGKEKLWSWNERHPFNSHAAFKYEALKTSVLSGWFYL